MRFAKELQLLAEFWLNLQQNVEFWHPMRSPAAKVIGKIKPLPKLAQTI